MSKGFGGVPGNMQALLKEAQKMQEKLQKTQEEIQQFEVTHQSGGGAVRVKMDGKYHIIELLIEKDAVTPDNVEILQELIIAAVNGAVEQVQEHSRTELEKVTGGINIPGLF